MKKIIILVVAILAVGAGAMAYASSKDSNNTQSNNTIDTQSTNSNTSSSSNSNESSNTNTQSNSSNSSSDQNSNSNSVSEQNSNNTNSNNESNSKSSPTAVINKFTTSKVINQYGVISNTNKPNNYDGLDWEPNTVKVFSCPDSYSKGIGNLTIGTKVFVLSEQTFEKAPKYWANSQVGTWAAIKFDNGNRTGYVYASTLNIN